MAPGPLGVGRSPAAHSRGLPPAAGPLGQAATVRSGGVVQQTSGLGWGWQWERVAPSPPFSLFSLLCLSGSLPLLWVQRSLPGGQSRSGWRNRPFTERRNVAWGAGRESQPSPIALSDRAEQARKISETFFCPLTWTFLRISLRT